jgi:hypothetical protein
LVNFLAAHRALLLACEERRLAARAQSVRRRWRQCAGECEIELPRKVVDQPSGRDVDSKRVVPVRQARVGCAQFEGADPGVVPARQAKTGLVRPGLHVRVARRQRQQALVGDQDQAGSEVQARVQVNFQPGQHLLVGSQLRLRAF